MKDLLFTFDHAEIAKILITHINDDARRKNGNKRWRKPSQKIAAEWTKRIKTKIMNKIQPRGSMQSSMSESRQGKALPKIFKRKLGGGAKVTKKSKLRKTD